MNILAFNHKFNELFFNKENLDILASFLSSFLDIPYEEINGNIVLLSDKKHYNCDESINLFIRLKEKKIRVQLFSPFYTWDYVDHVINYFGLFLYEAEKNSSWSYVQIHFEGLPDDMKDLEEHYMSDDDTKIENFVAYSYNLPNCNRLYQNNLDDKKHRWASIFYADDSSQIREALKDIAPNEVIEKIITIGEKNGSFGNGLASGFMLKSSIFWDGVKEAKEVIASKLHKRNYSIEEISEITNLKYEDILNL